MTNEQLEAVRAAMLTAFKAPVTSTFMSEAYAYAEDAPYGERRLISLDGVFDLDRIARAAIEAYEATKPQAWPIMRVDQEREEQERHDE